MTSKPIENKDILIDEKNRKPLIETKNLSKHFRVSSKSVLQAVDKVSLSIYEGETLGLVGESGCGKTTFGRTLVRLYKPTEGSIYFEGRDVSAFTGKALANFKKDAQIIFQDPYASLDPRMTVGEIVGEGIGVHFNKSAKERQDIVDGLLEKVGLHPEYGNRYAHEFSGGQRQRIGIARALAVEPRFIVCDEPISALDVSIQAQVINLLIGLQREFGFTYLFISHDLSMVRFISDRVGVMYLGSIVELASNREITDKPLHPYTQALLSAIPVADPDVGKTRHRVKLSGEIPSPINQPSGCKFHQRCKYVEDICTKETPPLREISKDHRVACHLTETLDLW